ncbi:hypothetical protein VTL71DRAFT_2011 [Oculimacula yallundae]|uniref:DUF6536 domain-containing protein n=1 Tax=Oculimacula yallundae TaxID=86028 RepID=A0ABR4CCB5_9HELO
MAFDARGFLPITSSTPSRKSCPEFVFENIELHPRDSLSQDPPQPLFKSTDDLLPLEQKSQYSESAKSSNVSVSERQQNQNGFEGWRLGASYCCAVVAASLILNLTVTVWASKTFGLSEGIGTIHRDTCPVVKWIGLWVHVAINVISTILLGASNYCMQCLCSPTRMEVNKAHARNTWLDIGIQSYRNLTKIRRSRAALWILLAASSIPLHLMFNSAIFVSLTANEYIVAAVTDDFINGAKWTLDGSDDFHHLIVAQMQQNISTYDRLEPEECIREYGVDYLSSRRHTLVVVSGQNPDPLLGILDWMYDESRNSWVCGTTQGANNTLETIPIDDFDCSVNVALYENDAFLMADREVLYCLSQKVEDQCRLQFAVPIMIAVLCCNFVKLLCMVVTIWMCQEPTFVTLGDALCSFLENPDPNTIGMCISTKKDFENRWPDGEPKQWTLKRHFRYEAVGFRRWLGSNTLCAAALISLSLTLKYAIHYTTTASDIKTLWDLGFGTVTSSSLIRWSTPMFGNPGLMKNVLLANSPQIILSLLYQDIVYNRIYTCMSFSKEWHDLAHRQRSLRVTSPRGSQQSTYFLSLPYRYLIPISLVSITTHWILSESLFLVAIDVYDEHGVLDVAQSLLTCGWSCIALIFLVGIGWLVLIIGLGMGLRRYNAGMPLAGSCSAALSAACHAVADEHDVSLVHVQWGVVNTSQGIGHCALSGRDISPPLISRWYRG